MDPRFVPRVSLTEPQILEDRKRNLTAVPLQKPDWCTKSKSKKKVIPCLKCKKKFTTKSVVNRHLKSVCAVADVGTISPTDNEPSSKKNNDVSLKESSDVRFVFHSCHICMKKFQNKGYLMKHYTTEHGAVGDVGTISPTGSLTEPHILEDRKRNLTAVPLQRPDCTKSKSEKKVDKKYQCLKCKKMFSSKGMLNRHLKNVCSDKPYHCCQLCKKVFKCKDYLYNHMRYAHRNALNEPSSKKNNDVSLKESSDSGIWIPSCYICMKKFQNKEYLMKHLKIEHGNVCTISPTDNEPSSKDNSDVSLKESSDTGIVIHSCHICMEKFQNKKYLMKHFTTEHGAVGDVGTISPTDKETSSKKNSDVSLKESSDSGIGIQVCHICMKCFQNKGDLMEHNTTEHGAVGDVGTISPTVRKNKWGKRIIPLCYVDLCNRRNFTSMMSYRFHLKYDHNKDLTKSIYTFSSFEEFEHWKENMERTTGNGYFRKGKTKRRTLYLCRRSGKFKPRGTGKRRMKKQNSIKIGGNCTSTIELCVSDGIYEATFYEDHYGHALDENHFKHTSIPRSTKKFVLDKLGQNVSRKDIVKMVREWSSDARSSLITCQDILNIEIKKHSQINHENDVENKNHSQINHENDVHDIRHTSDEDMTVIQIFDDSFFSEKGEIEQLREEAQASLSRLSRSLNKNSKHSVEHFKKILSLIKKADNLDQKGPQKKRPKKK